MQFQIGDKVRTTASGGAVPSIGVTGLVGEVVSVNVEVEVSNDQTLADLGYVAAVQFKGHRSPTAVKEGEIELLPDLRSVELTHSPTGGWGVYIRDAQGRVACFKVVNGSAQRALRVASEIACREFGPVVELISNPACSLWTLKPAPREHQATEADIDAAYEQAQQEAASE
jgi:hypothetical protein